MIETVIYVAHQNIFATCIKDSEETGFWKWKKVVKDDRVTKGNLYHVLATREALYGNVYCKIRIVYYLIVADTGVKQWVNSEWFE